MSYLGVPPLSPPTWPDLKAWRDLAQAWEAEAERLGRLVGALRLELAALKLAPARPPEPPAPTAPDPRAVADAAVGRIVR